MYRGWDNGSDMFSSAGSFAFNQWQRVVIVLQMSPMLYETVGIQFYVEGQLVATAVHEHMHQDSWSSLVITSLGEAEEEASGRGVDSTRQSLLA